MNLNDTEMVVVSGCDSGKGGIVYGENIYGLKRAFAVAGARSSLLTLWRIDDYATVAFMESFYNKLKDYYNLIHLISIIIFVSIIIFNL